MPRNLSPSDGIIEQRKRLLQPIRQSQAPDEITIKESAEEIQIVNLRQEVLVEVNTHTTSIREVPVEKI